MAVGTFLEGYDLTGKTIVPFCTSTDNGIDVSMDYIREVSKGATVLDGKRIHNSDLEDVSAWLYDIGMLKQTDEPEDEEGGQMETAKDAEDIEPGENEFGYVTAGTEEYRGFVIDNVFHSVSEGDIHYHVYIPESYDGSSLYALYFAIGKNDEYYGSGPTQEAYDALYELYENQGLTKEEIVQLKEALSSRKVSDPEIIPFLYSEGDTPFCFLKILLKYRGLSYPTIFPISVTL